MLSYLMRVVIDTNVLVGAMLAEGGASREILRLCLTHQVTPVIGLALFVEMEDVLERSALFDACVLNKAERDELFRAFLSTTSWVPLYYKWRPNLRDEADNHIIELAVAANATCVITKNLRDFASMELQFDGLKIASPSQFLEKWR